MSRNPLKRRRKFRRSAAAYFVIVAIAISIFLIANVAAQPGSRVKPTSISESHPKKGAKIVYLKPKYKCAVADDPESERIFAEYGAVVAADKEVLIPDRCIYDSESDVAEFQRRAKTAKAMLGGIEIELQEAAMRALLDADTEAAERRRRIRPLDGPVAAKRSYADTARLWNSRFLPALAHWERVKRIASEDAADARSAGHREQVRRVIDWEKQGMLFGTGRRGSIFASVAPPGTSHHVFMLAIDVANYGDPLVIAAMNRNGWYQTVLNDPPHFTYLGIDEEDLPARGLKKVYRGRIAYWVPNLKPRPQQTLERAND